VSTVVAFAVDPQKADFDRSIHSVFGWFFGPAVGNVDPFVTARSAMIFTTYWFVLFIAILLPLYWLARPGPLRLALLLVACSVFHARFAGAAGMLPIIVLCTTTYFAGLSGRRWVLNLGIASPVLALIFYKYTQFVSLKVLAHLSPHWGAQLNDALVAHLPATPPLGVSFFAFEFVHYLYDVRKGQPPIRNPAHFWAFTFFFPSLVAGPIKRYQPFLRSLREGLTAVSLEDVKFGLWRVALGYVKKVVIADNLTAAIQYWQPKYAELAMSSRWLFLAALSFRILLDFSGYSDIAIGFARLMGVRLLENFRWPYLAGSMQDFWRRWHMSLSSWIRDYVYIPLGGSRVSPPRKALNGLIAFALCGLWHGPEWNFVLWGLWHGFGLVVNTTYVRLLGPAGESLSRLLQRAPVVPWALTMLFVGVGWLGFFYPVPDCFNMVRLLFVQK
jgi:alginate O-acetyltransferase complex protein AlgI